MSTIDRRHRGRAIRRARRLANRAITHDCRASTVSVELSPKTELIEQGIRKVAEQISALSGTPFAQLAQTLRAFVEAVAEHPAPRPRQILHNGRKP